jgi:hypothetical protein
MTERPSDKEFMELCMQTPEQKKDRRLLPLYGKSPGMKLEPHTDRRIEEQGCLNKKCDGTERRPSLLLQYMETCIRCGIPIGENSSY